MRDNRIASIVTADAFARYNRGKLLFVVEGSSGAIAVYIFAVRVFSKGWRL